MKSLSSSVYFLFINHVNQLFNTVKLLIFMFLIDINVNDLSLFETL